MIARAQSITGRLRATSVQRVRGRRGRPIIRSGGGGGERCIGTCGRQSERNGRAFAIAFTGSGTRESYLHLGGPVHTQSRGDDTGGTGERVHVQRENGLGCRYRQVRRGGCRCRCSAGACERCDICGVSLSLIASGRIPACMAHSPRWNARRANQIRFVRTLREGGNHVSRDERSADDWSWPFSRYQSRDAFEGLSVSKFHAFELRFRRYSWSLNFLKFCVSKKKKKCSKWFFLSCLYGTGIFKFLFFVIRGNLRDFFLDHLRRKHSYFCYQDFDILYVQMTRSIDSTDLRSRFNSFCSLSRSSSSHRIGHGSERNCREMRFLARAREIGSAPI